MNEKVVALDVLRQVDQEAAAWVSRLLSGLLTEAESEQLRQWCQKSPRHREMLVELAGLWDELERMSVLAELIPRDEVAQRSKRRLPCKIRWSAGIMVAASIVLAMCLFVPELLLPDRASAPAVNRISTAVGENRRVDLLDGSRLTLNTYTELTVAYSGTERRVNLRRGEAGFQAARDVSRPFVVSAGGTLITAVGTAFNIELSGDRIDVLVTEGAVSIKRERFSGRDGDASARPRQVLAGERAVIFRHRQQIDLDKVDEEQIEQQLAWRHQRLIFTGQAMVDVIAELSRYTHQQFVFEDDRAKRIRVGGYFSSEDIDQAIDILSANFDLAVELSGGVVYLGSKASREPPRD